MVKVKLMEMVSGKRIPSGNWKDHIRQPQQWFSRGFRKPILCDTYIYGRPQTRQDNVFNTNHNFHCWPFSSYGLPHLHPDISVLKEIRWLKFTKFSWSRSASSYLNYSCPLGFLALTLLSTSQTLPLSSKAKHHHSSTSSCPSWLWGLPTVVCCHQIDPLNEACELKIALSRPTADEC